MIITVESADLSCGLRIALQAMGKGGKGRNVKHPDVIVEVKNNVMYIVGTNGYWLAVYKMPGLDGSNPYPDGLVSLSRDMAESVLKAATATGPTPCAIDFGLGNIDGMAVSLSPPSFAKGYHAILEADFTRGTPTIGFDPTYIEDIAKCFRMAGHKEGLRFDFSGGATPARITAAGPGGDPTGPLLCILSPVDLCQRDKEENGPKTLDSQLKGFSEKAKGNLVNIRNGKSVEAKMKLAQGIMQESAMITEMLRATITAVEERTLTVSEALKQSLL